MQQVIIHTDGSCLGNPGPGRLGRRALPGGHLAPQGTCGRLCSDHQQPHGNYGRAGGVGRAQGTLRRGTVHGFAICLQQRGKTLALGLAEKKLAQGRQKPRKERGSLGKSFCRNWHGTRCAFTGCAATRAMPRTSAATFWPEPAPRTVICRRIPASTRRTSSAPCLPPCLPLTQVSP